MSTTGRSSSRAAEWFDGVYEYELAIALPTRSAGEEMLAARVGVVAGRELAGQALIAVTWAERAAPAAGSGDLPTGASAQAGKVPTGASPESPGEPPTGASAEPGELPTGASAEPGEPPTGASSEPPGELPTGASAEPGELPTGASAEPGELPTGASAERPRPGGPAGGADPCAACGALPEEGDRFCEACGRKLAGA